jgi:hypothetical protein
VGITETDHYRLTVVTAGFRYVIDVAAGYKTDAVRAAIGGLRLSVVIDTTAVGLEITWSGLTIAAVLSS